MIKIKEKEKVMKTLFALVTILSLGIVLDNDFDQAVETCQKKNDYTLKYCTDKLR